MKRVNFAFSHIFLVLFFFQSNGLFASQDTLSHTHKSYVEKREEFQRLVERLKIRNEDKERLQELEERTDKAEIEKIIQGEIESVTIKIKKLALELNEAEVAELLDEETSQWKTVACVCLGAGLLSVLALASCDPYDGLQFPPSIKQIEKNFGAIRALFS